jgi:hypothetical protein
VSTLTPGHTRTLSSHPSGWVTLTPPPSFNAAPSGGGSGADPIDRSAMATAAVRHACVRLANRSINGRPLGEPPPPLPQIIVGGSPLSQDLSNRGSHPLTLSPSVSSMSHRLTFVIRHPLCILSVQDAPLRPHPPPPCSAERCDGVGCRNKHRKPPLCETSLPSLPSLRLRRHRHQPPSHPAPQLQPLPAASDIDRRCTAPGLDVSLEIVRKSPAAFRACAD